MAKSLPKTYEVIPERGRFRVRRVPIFAETVKKGTDGEVHVFDRTWLLAAAECGNAEQKRGYYAPVHLVHHGRVAAPERVADLENYVVEDAVFEEPFVAEDGSLSIKSIVRPVIFADLLLDNEKALEKANGFPHRSVEIWDPKMPRINSVALLGAEEPHLRFPNLRVDQVPTLALQAASSGRGVVASWSRPLCFARYAMEDKKDAVAAKSEDASSKPDVSADETPSWASQLMSKIDALCEAMMPKAAPTQASQSVTPVAMEGSSEKVLALQAEVTVLRDKATVAERRLGVSDAIVLLEREGHVVGPGTRKLLEETAAKGASLDSIVSAVRLHAPKLPTSSSERGVQAQAAKTKDVPAVIAVAPNAESPERAEARELHLQFELLKSKGWIPNTTFEKFFNDQRTRKPAVNGAAN